MSKQMGEMVQSMEMQEMRQMKQSVKLLLKNILKMSFDQEDLLDQTKIGEYIQSKVSRYNETATCSWG